LTEPQQDEDVVYIENKPEYIVYLLLAALAIAVLGTAISNALFLRL